MLDTGIRPSISVTIEFLVTSLPKTFFAAQFGGTASSGKSLVVPNILHFRMMEASVFLGTPLGQQKLFIFPRSLFQYDGISELQSSSFDLMAFYSDMHCQLIKRNGGPPQLKFTCHRNGCSVAKL